MKKAILALSFCALSHQAAFGSCIPTYHNRLSVFEGYERIKPDSVYWGILSWSTYNLTSDEESWIFNAEFRLGYNFFTHKTRISPYVGFGYFDDFKRCHDHQKEYIRKFKEHSLEYDYISLGFSADHSFNNLFSLGLNGKGMYGKGMIGSRHHNNEWTSGVDVGVPFTFYFGRKRTWDIRAEPFYIYLSSNSESTNYAGVRLFIDYNF